MTELADTLDALNVNTIPSTVRDRTRGAERSAAARPALFARLIASLQLHQVLAEPQWPIDPSAAAARGPGAALHDRGCATVGPASGFSGSDHRPSPRSTIFADEPIGGGGAALRLRPRRSTDGDDAADLRRPRRLHRSLQRLQGRTDLGTSCRTTRDFDVAVVDHIDFATAGRSPGDTGADEDLRGGQPARPATRHRDLRRERATTPCGGGCNTRPRHTRRRHSSARSPR